MCIWSSGAVAEGSRVEEQEVAETVTEDRNATPVLSEKSTQEYKDIGNSTVQKAGGYVSLPLCQQQFYASAIHPKVNRQYYVCDLLSPCWIQKARVWSYLSEFFIARWWLYRFTRFHSLSNHRRFKCVLLRAPTLEYRTVYFWTFGL